MKIDQLIARANSRIDQVREQMKEFMGDPEWNTRIAEELLRLAGEAETHMEMNIVQLAQIGADACMLSLMSGGQMSFE